MAKKDPLNFWKKYELAFSTRDFKPVRLKKKICRYCKRDESVTTFRKQAHIIPELFGGNKFIAQDECDECNQKFSAYESHLSKFFMPYLTMGGVKGKRGVPQFHSRTVNGNENTRTVITAADNKRQILLADQNDYSINEKEKTMMVVFRKPPLKPRWVLKALTKIGLSLIPFDWFADYDNVSKWLLNQPTDIQFFPLLIHNILTYRKMAMPFADLYKAKRILFSRTFVPEYTLVVGFGNVICQVFLPTSTHPVYLKAQNKTASLNVFPSFILDDTKKKKEGLVSFVSLESNETINHNESLNFHFSETSSNLAMNCNE